MIWLKQNGWNILTSGFSVCCFFDQFPGYFTQRSKPSFAWTRKRDRNTIYLPGNFYVVEEARHDERWHNLLWRQHYLRTFLDLNFHLFEQIIRVCRYDGFSSGQWKNKMDRVIIFWNNVLGSHFVAVFSTLEASWPIVMITIIIWCQTVAYETRLNKTTLITTLSRLGFTGSGKFLNEMLL